MPLFASTTICSDLDRQRRERQQREQRRGRIAARIGDERRAADRVAIAFGETVDRRARSCAQAEGVGQVDDARAAADERFGRSRDRRRRHRQGRRRRLRTARASAAPGGSKARSSVRSAGAWSPTRAPSCERLSSAPSSMNGWPAGETDQFGRGVAGRADDVNARHAGSFGIAIEHAPQLGERFAHELRSGRTGSSASRDRGGGVERRVELASPPHRREPRCRSSSSGRPACSAAERRAPTSACARRAGTPRAISASATSVATV